MTKKLCWQASKIITSQTSFFDAEQWLSVEFQWSHVASVTGEQKVLFRHLNSSLRRLRPKMFKRVDATLPYFHQGLTRLAQRH